MGDNKTRPNNRCRQFARKVGPSDNSVRYSSVYHSLDRLAIARERTPSVIQLPSVWDILLPWHRHQIEVPNGLYRFIRKAMWRKRTF